MSKRFVTFASVISEIEQSDIFMTVKARILEAPKANLNGARVTEAFVDDIIANKERYIGLPLYADKKALDSGKYNRLGHLYDSKTGEFHSTQIGSFYEFEKEEFKGGCYLVGYARIPKRDMTLSKAIAELFTEGKLKFSFEIACGDYQELDDGTIEIDASDNNYLEGTAIVTFPACEDAVALEFVAQHEADDTNRGDEKMAESEKAVAEVETNIETAEAAPQTAEEQNKKAETEQEEAAENAACGKKDKENACEEKNEETAAVYVTDTHIEELHTSMYDSETGKEAFQSIEVRTSVTDVVDGNIVETDDGVHVAETVSAEGEGDSGDASAETPEEAPAEEPAQEQENGQEETPAKEQPETPVVEPVVPEVPAVPAAQQEVSTEQAINTEEESKKIAETLNALTETVKALAEEIRAMKEEKQARTIASHTVTAETVNPFVDSMTANGKKWSLLEKDTSNQKYTLLNK